MAQKLKRLTAMQQEFVRALAKDARANQTKAAKTAGYSEKKATCIGSQLMALPHVQDAYVAEVEKLRPSIKNIDESWLIEKLAAIASAHARDYLEISSAEDAKDLFPDQSLAIQRFVKKTLNDGSGDFIIEAILCDKMQAIKTIAQMKGLLRNQHDVKIELTTAKAESESFLGRMVELATALSADIVFSKPDPKPEATT